jgi:hypothetical protein
MTASALHLGLDPLLPLHWIIVLASCALLLAVWNLLHRQRGAYGRLLAALLFVALLLNPQLRQERRLMQPDIGLIVIDGSASMAFDDRGKIAAAAAKALQAKAAPDLVWRSVVSGGAERSDIMAAMTKAMAAIPPERFAGSVLISDGLVHDVAALQSGNRPVNSLIAGNADVIDRQLSMISAPAFAIINQSTKLVLQVHDTGTSPVPVSLRIGDQPARTVMLVPGQPTAVPITLTRRGNHDIIVKVAPRAGDILPSNDVALVSMQGVRERLAVLLVTGSPYPGARLWRDTLKADSSIDLVHFTILRTPSSLDAASTAELALIPFPVEQLFEQRLSRFDLVIFDRYAELELLQTAYFKAVADYVRKGGALLVVAGPEYVGANSLANTPLQNVLPVMPRSDAPEAAFKPQLALVGQRHPITRNLVQPWGNWFRYARARATHGDTLMQTPSGDPLLQIATVANGRVAVLLSDQLWLWARADAGGPWNDLVRRTAHWLMKEPDLESEQLELHQIKNQVQMTRRSVAPAALPAQISMPDGAVQTLVLKPDASGAAASITLAKPGLIQVRSGALERSLNTAASIAELHDARPTASRLQAVANQSGGSLHWLDRGVPALHRIDRSVRHPAGLVLLRNRQSRLTGYSERPLLPDWAWLALLLAALLLGWRLDSDRR